MSPSDESPIEWERLARDDARARHFGVERRSEIVRRGGGDPLVDEAQGARARRALLEEAFAQESALASRYAAPFSAERRRLEAEKPPIESLGELPPPSAVLELQVPAPVALAASTAPVAAEDAPATPHDVRRPAAVAPPSTGPKLVPTYLQAPAEATAPTAVEVRLARLTGMNPDVTQPPVHRSEPTLPFFPGAKGEVPPAVRAIAKEPEDQEEEGTRSGDETAFLPRRLITGPATPFEKATDEAGEASQQASEKKAVEAAETVALDGDAVRAAAAAPEPWVSLDEYASFLADLAQDPGQAGVLRAKYGIAGEDAQRALGAGFAARFTREPGLRARFDEALARERARRR